MSFTFDSHYLGRKDPRTRNKGVMRARRAQKRKEAEDRNSLTPIQHRAIFRRQSPEVQAIWLAEGKAV